MVGRRSGATLSRSLWALFAVALLVTACGGSGGSTASSSNTTSSSGSTSSGNGSSGTSSKPAKAYTIKWAVGQGSADPVSVAARQFQSAVQKASNGGLKVQLFYSGQLGSNAAVTQDTINGSVQMFTEDPQVLVSTYGSAGFTDLPYLFSSQAQVAQYWAGPVGKQETAAILQHTGLRILDVMYYGFHSAWNNQHPITSLAGYRGLKMGTPPSKVFLALWNAVGVQPVIVHNLPQLYTSLKQGIAQAADQSPSSGSAIKLYQVTKYFSYTRDNFSTAITYINNKFWNTLPAKYQKLIASEALTIQTSQRQAEAAANAKAIALMKQNGVKVNTISSSARKQFQKAVQPVYQKAGTLFGPDAAKWLKEWQSAQKSAS